MFGRTRKKLDERDARCLELRKQRDEARRERDGLKTRNKELTDTIKQINGPSLPLDHAMAALIEARRLLAARYLKGEGMEIGAMHCPVAVPPGVKVIYADYKSKEDSMRKHPELDPTQMVDVDLIMNGETLDEIPDGSLGFVIANHMLEHCEDFVRVLKNFYRVLKPEGVLFIALPDKRYTFDYRRPLTPYEHIVQDHRVGPLEKRYDHYVEFSTLVSETPVTELDSESTVMGLPHLDIHYHVWDQAGMIRLINDLRTDFDLSYEMECYMKNGIEGIFILRKTTVEVFDRAKPSTFLRH